ncbi:hypothetical protein SK128_012313, partial [Halocaridina rubra]
SLAIEGVLSISSYHKTHLPDADIPLQSYSAIRDPYGRFLNYDKGPHDRHKYGDTRYLIWMQAQAYASTLPIYQAYIVSPDACHPPIGRGKSSIMSYCIKTRTEDGILHPRIGGTGIGGPIWRSPAGTDPNPSLWFQATAVASPVSSLNYLAWTRRDTSTSQMRGQRITTVLARKLSKTPHVT